MSTSTTAAEAILSALAEAGVDYLFANAGTDFPPAIEALAGLATGWLNGLTRAMGRSPTDLAAASAAGPMSAVYSVVDASCRSHWSTDGLRSFSRSPSR